MEILDIKNLQSLNEFLINIKWQSFEELVEYIFEENGFKNKGGFVKVFKNKKRRQYDLLAEDFSRLFIIDCKKWSGNRYKSNALRNAIEKQMRDLGLLKQIRKKLI